MHKRKEQNESLDFKITKIQELQKGCRSETHYSPHPMERELRNKDFNPITVNSFASDIYFRNCISRLNRAYYRKMFSQGVTLGGTGKEVGDRHPKVGEGALIGASATILGNIKIGKGAMVAAGSLVLKDVPPHR